MQGQPDLAGANQPANQAQRESGRHLAAVAVHALHGRVHGIGAHGQPRPVALAEHLRQQAQHPAEQAALLHHVETRDAQRKHGGDDQRWRAQVGERIMPAIQAKQRQAGKGKDHLRQRLHGGTDGDGRSGVAHARAAVRQVAHHQDRAADLPRRQQAVDGFAGPACQQRVAHGAVAGPAVEQDEDGAGVQHQRQQVERGDQHQAPACRHQRRRDGAESLPGEQRDKERRADRQEKHGSTGHGRGFRPGTSLLNTCLKPK